MVFAWLAELIPQLCAAKIILFVELCNNDKRCVGVFEENRGNRANGTNKSDKANRADCPIGQICRIEHLGCIGLIRQISRIHDSARRAMVSPC